MGKESGTCLVCSAGLPDLPGMNYCPYCGGELKTDALPDGLPKKSLGEQQRAAREKYADMAKLPRVRIAPPEEIYSLVLKGCDNKEALVECLDHVLTRGETAIRLAVNAMPSILLYKSDKESVDAVIAVLRDAEAVYAVVEGTFDYSSFYKSGYFTGLDIAGKAFLQSIPKNMWLGENIKFISADMFFERKRGFGVFSDNALFFFWTENGVAKNWLLPVYQLDALEAWEDGGSYFGEWLANDGRSFQMEFIRPEDFAAVRQLSW